ncbi:MAG: hypothetical protein IJV33_00480 [Bacteroidaceae bacterium]|nr:hypothetical protein [Bacteroidaceae bacterium]
MNFWKKSKNQVLLTWLSHIVILILYPYSIWFGIPLLISMGIVAMSFMWMVYLSICFISQKKWVKVSYLLILNMLIMGVSVMVVGIYDKSVDWEFSQKPIIYEKDAKDFGVWVCEYKQADSQPYNSIPITGKIWACCYSNYPKEYKTKREITVEPDRLVFMLEIKDGDYVYEQMLAKECYISRLAGGYHDYDLPMLIDIGALKDTIVVYINSYDYDKGRADSITFVRDGEPDLSLYDPNNHQAVYLTRPRSLKDRIKDWFFVDEVRYYLRKRELIEADKCRMAEIYRREYERKYGKKESSEKE